MVNQYSVHKYSRDHSLRIIVSESIVDVMLSSIPGSPLANNCTSWASRIITLPFSQSLLVLLPFPGRSLFQLFSLPFAFSAASWRVIFGWRLRYKITRWLKRHCLTNYSSYSAESLKQLQLYWVSNLDIENWRSIDGKPKTKSVNIHHRERLCLLIETDSNYR